MKFYEVFKTGTYPQGKFTKKEIALIAKNYDPKFCEAPVTIDHQQSGPAYGWVDSVKAEGDKLKVSFKDIPEEFEKDVNAGKYKKVSVELYRNLEGKGAYLKAVSFLGAAIPQVKGLEAIKFMEAEAYTFEFEEDNNSGNNDDKNILENFSENETEKLKQQIVELEEQIANFKENNKKLETIKSLKEKISVLTEEVTAFREKAKDKEDIEKELESIKLSVKNREYSDFIDKQIEKGILVPSNKEVVLSVLKELDNVRRRREPCVEFADRQTEPFDGDVGVSKGNSTGAKQFGEDSTALKGFKSFIESLPPQINFEETATKEKANEIKQEELEKFANADEESLEIFKEAKALAQKENISFKDALLRLNK